MAEQVVDDVDPRLDEDFLADFGDRWWAAWNSHDARRVTALCTPDVEWRDPSMQPARGHGVIEAAMEMFATACPDFRFERSEPPYRSPVQRKAIAPWRCSGTMTGPLEPPGFAPTGRRLAWHGDDHWDFRGDLVCRCESVYDVYAIAMRIGAVPAPGSRAEQVAVALQRLAARRARRQGA